MPCSNSSEGEAAAAICAVVRRLVTASRNSAAPVLRARIEERYILFIRQNLPPNCYRRITSISVVCHLPRSPESAGDTVFSPFLFGGLSKQLRASEPIPSVVPACCAGIALVLRAYCSLAHPLYFPCTALIYPLYVLFSNSAS